MAESRLAVYVAAITRGSAAAGVRVLLVAEHDVDKRPDECEPELEPLGLIGLSDPLRETAPDGVADAARAGVRTVMVTGDEPRTAAAVARACSIGGADPQVLSGAALWTHSPMAAGDSDR